MSEYDSVMYIVGGLPRTGKTTVANRLAHTRRIGAMETDHVRMLFKPTSTSKIGSDSGAEIPVVTKKLRPRLESVIESLMTADVSFVINGECVDPNMVAESPFRQRIKSCFMGLNDAQAAHDRIRSVADPNDWAMHKTDEELERILQKYAVRSRELGKTCARLALPYIDASRNFLLAHEQAYAILNADDR